MLLAAEVVREKLVLYCNIAGHADVAVGVSIREGRDAGHAAANNVCEVGLG